MHLKPSLDFVIKKYITFSPTFNVCGFAKLCFDPFSTPDICLAVFFSHSFVLPLHFFLRCYIRSGIPVFYRFKFSLSLFLSDSVGKVSIFFSTVFTTYIRIPKWLHPLRLFFVQVYCCCRLFYNFSCFNTNRRMCRFFMV